MKDEDGPKLKFRDEISKIKACPMVPKAVAEHLESIFFAGCNESSLDSAELTRSTINVLSRPAQSLRLELGLFVLLGLFGTMSGLAETLSQIRVDIPAEEVVQSVSQLLAGLKNAFAPALLGVLLSIAGGIVYGQYRQRALENFSETLRGVTLRKWIPSLYPTLGQRAAGWALETLQHASNVTEAAKTIEKDTLELRASMLDAREAGSEFAKGIRAFKTLVLDSDKSLLDVRSGLAREIEKFGISLSRWSSFEDEIRSFYRAAQACQLAVAKQQEHLEQILELHRTIQLESSSSLQSAALGVASAIKVMPRAFDAAATKVTQTSNAFDGAVKSIVEQLSVRLAEQADVLQLLHREQLGSTDQRFSALIATHQKRLEVISQPILDLERRIGGIAEPFLDTARNLGEIATNLWKLNQTSAVQARELIASMDLALNGLNARLDRLELSFVPVRNPLSHSSGTIVVNSASTVPNIGSENLLHPDGDYFESDGVARG